MKFTKLYIMSQIAGIPAVPLERVSWNNAVEFCQYLSEKTGQKYRLPSEAEWEYACRAGTTTPFNFGEMITTELAIYRKKTTEAGRFPPNVFGLYDMHGNVWEWCQDNWHDSYKGAPTDGSAWIDEIDNQLRVLRGGSWDFTCVSPVYCRSAIRSKKNSDYDCDNIGFRVVMG